MWGREEEEGLVTGEEGAQAQQLVSTKAPVPAQGHEGSSQQALPEPTTENISLSSQGQIAIDISTSKVIQIVSAQILHETEIILPHISPESPLASCRDLLKIVQVLGELRT